MCGSCMCDFWTSSFRGSFCTAESVALQTICRMPMCAYYRLRDLVSFDSQASSLINTRSCVQKVFTLRCEQHYGSPEMQRELYPHSNQADRPGRTNSSSASFFRSKLLQALKSLQVVQNVHASCRLSTSLRCGST